MCANCSPRREEKASLRADYRPRAEYCARAAWPRTFPWSPRRVAQRGVQREQHATQHQRTRVRVWAAGPSSSAATVRRTLQPCRRLLEGVLARFLHPVRQVHGKRGKHVVRVQSRDEALVTGLQEGLREQSSHLAAHAGKALQGRYLGDAERRVHVGNRRVQRRAFHHPPQGREHQLVLCKEKRAAAAGDDVFRRQRDEADIRTAAAGLLSKCPAKALRRVLKDGKAMGPSVSVSTITPRVW